MELENAVIRVRSELANCGMFYLYDRYHSQIITELSVCIKNTTPKAEAHGIIYRVVVNCIRRAYQDSFQE